MSGDTRAIPVAPVLGDEDLARRDWYLLLARLFREPPDAAVLSAVAAAGPAEPPGSDAPDLVRAFAELALACGQSDPESVRQEFDAAFLGVGKAEVFLNASWHLTGFLNDRPLVELRDCLADLGLARREDIGETEDHIAALCETMALLIGSQDPRLASVDTQREFFQRFLAPWFDSLCDAIERSGSTDFYKHAARAARAFLAVERQAFDFE
ncbi:molecular chaperone TorD family protein [Burkholderiaceae bacterium FT117]|uniref:TorD/DmsD family molecular chaperone n=1 Tax=Zeimonas sediminis TaxID=2944268 RepID=UPI0023430B4C|nr:molecular chaperone TorD family protein [Zeimonas sediminis]MCM5568990.1 molecular chaperone TorD family protein [Zeimonas sediminis]